MNDVQTIKSLLDKNKYPVPDEILIRPDKVLYHNKKYLILDGIDIKGRKIEDGLVRIYYTDGSNYLNFDLTKDIWGSPKFFWGWVEGVIDAMKRGI